MAMTDEERRNAAIERERTKAERARMWEEIEMRRGRMDDLRKQFIADTDLKPAMFEDLNGQILGLNLWREGQPFQVDTVWIRSETQDVFTWGRQFQHALAHQTPAAEAVQAMMATFPAKVGAK